MDVRRIALVGASWLALAGAAAGQDAQATAAAGGPPPSAADAREARIRELEDRLAAIEAQLADLKESSAADTADVRRVQAEQPQVTLNNARLRAASADSQFNAQLRGVAQYEIAQFDQDNPLVPDNRRSDSSNPADLSGGGNFRRARFGVEGTAFRDWNYALIYELGGTGTESAQMSQAYLEYAGWKPWENAAPLRFRIGAWATPTGLEDATSNTEHVFLEWAAPADLARAIAGGDGRTGAGVFANGDRWYASGVLTGALMANTGEFDEQTGYLARAALLPLRGENHAVHIGGGPMSPA